MKKTANGFKETGGCASVESAELPALAGALKRKFGFKSRDKEGAKVPSQTGLVEEEKVKGENQIVNRAYKFRIYPNKNQRSFINQTMGCCRWLWNHSLAKIKEAESKIKKETPKEESKEIRKAVNVFALSRQIPNLKKTPESSFLKSAISISLIQTLRHLDTAKSNWIRNLKNGKVKQWQNDYISHCKLWGLEPNWKKYREIGMPKFKAKGHRQSCSFHQAYSLEKEKGILNIPKCEGIKIKLHRNFVGITKTVTIEKTPSGKYFASILVQEEMFIPTPIKPEEKNTIGIHNGIKTFVTSDEGIEIEKTNRFLKNSLKRLKVLSKRFSRKIKKSGKWEKQRLQIAKLHERIANQRNYLLHQTANKMLSLGYKTIALEDWDKKEMMKNPIFAQAIADVSWEKLIQYVKYKGVWKGNTILELDPITANAKTCSDCDHINDFVELKHRQWTCENCGSVHKREHNCAKNSKKMCLKNIEDEKDE